jgi:hypothetical protein
MTEDKKSVDKNNGGMKNTRVWVESYSISLDGYGAGPDQSIDNPLGIGGGELHNWFLLTQTFRRMHRSFDPRAVQEQEDGMTAPVLLERGERLFEGVDLRNLGYECVQFVASEKASHVILQHKRNGKA